VTRILRGRSAGAALTTAVVRADSQIKRGQVSSAACCNVPSSLPHRLLCGILVGAGLAFAPLAGEAGSWGDPAKTLRVAMEVDVTGFDPAATQDLYSFTIDARIFDALYVWDYLAPPYRFVPSVAAAMPEISSDGRTWTIRIKPGIYFASDPAFGGKKRELTAQDFVYSWKRLLDPRVHSPTVDLLEGKLVGIDAAIAKARASGRFDYDSQIDGLKAVDRYTLQLTLVEPDYTLLPYLGSVPLRAVAREVIEKYADSSGRVMDHPVGTGPYRMKEWRHGQKVVLEANPDYREEYFPEALSNADAATKALASAMKGKRIPQIGTIDIAIIEESNPRLLAFDRGELDLLDVRYDLALKVVDEAGRLRPAYASRGVQLGRATELSLAYSYFNMEDPVVGGYSPEKVALRRAICTAYNTDEEIRIIRQGQGMPASQPIPPDVAGHVPGLKPQTPYNPTLARALLDRFGYTDRDGDGYRDLPDGRPLVLHIASAPDQTSRLFDELWQRSMQQIGIKVEFIKQKWPDLFKAARAGKLQFSELGLSGGVADYYMQQFYGPSAGAANLARFRNADFDKLFLQSRRVADPEERTNLYAKMTEIVAAYNPWCPEAFRISNTVVASWVTGYKKNVYYFITPWHYLDIDVARQSAAK
jgi:ABC-type transport system substrate-binding protein